MCLARAILGSNSTLSEAKVSTHFRIQNTSSSSSLYFPHCKLYLTNNHHDCLPSLRGAPNRAHYPRPSSIRVSGAGSKKRVSYRNEIYLFYRCRSVCQELWVRSALFSDPSWPSFSFCSYRLFSATCIVTAFHWNMTGSC